MYEKLKRKTIAPNMMQSTFTQQNDSIIRNHVMRHNNQQQQINEKNDDIISRLGRSSSVARSVYGPHHQQQQEQLYSKTPTRIPSPVKSIYSVRSHRRRFHEGENYHNKDNNNGHF